MQLGALGYIPGSVQQQQEYKNGCDEPGEYPHDRGIARASDEIERALLYDIDDTMERLSRLCTMPTNGYWAAVVVEGLSIANDSVCGYRQNEYVGNPDWRSDILTQCFAHSDFAVRYETLQLAETWPEEGVSVLQQVRDTDKHFMNARNQILGQFNAKSS